MGATIHTSRGERSYVSATSELATANDDDVWIEGYERYLKFVKPLNQWNSYCSAKPVSFGRARPSGPRMTWQVTLAATIDSVVWKAMSATLRECARRAMP